MSGDDPGTQLGYCELTALALRNPSMHDLGRHQYSSCRAAAAHALAPVPEDVDPHRVAALDQFVGVTFDGIALAWLADPEGTQPEQVLHLLAEAIVQAKSSGSAADVSSSGT